jgi:hypothetical protein
LDENNAIDSNGVPGVDVEAARLEFGERKEKDNPTRGKVIQ